MQNAIYYYFFKPPLEEIPSLMQERFGIVPKLTFTDEPFSDTNFCLWQAFPNMLEIFPLIKKYSNEDIKIPEAFNQYMISNTFTMYVDHLSRFDTFYQCCYHDYINHFNIISNFMYKYIIKENIDIVYFSNFPHMGFDLILYYVATYLKVKTFFIAQETEKETNIPVLTYATDINFSNLYHDMTQKLRQSKLVIPLGYEKNLWYMKKFDRFSLKNYRPKMDLFNRIRTAMHIIATRFDKPKVERFVNQMNRYKKAKITMSAKNKYINSKIDFNDKYVYFGLHLQPEATTSFYGNMYCDQILAIEKLQNLIPHDWKIYVKENPKQLEFQRYKLFYDRLCLMDNVVLVPDETNTYDLIEHSQFVASITGTMIYEAISGGKPAVIFGSHWYENLPGVFKYNDNLKLENILNCKIEHEKVQQATRDFYSRCIDGVTEPAYSKQENFDKAKNNENIIKLLSMALN